MAKSTKTESATKSLKEGIEKTFNAYSLDNAISLICETIRSNLPKEEIENDDYTALTINELYNIKSKMENKKDLLSKEIKQIDKIIKDKTLKP